MVLSVRRSFHGFIGFLVFCWSVATPCISFATEVGYPTTDVWIPLDEAYPYVEDLYTTYNGALSEGSGVTVTADNYDELVARSIIGNWVATNMAFGEDVSLDGIMDVIEADADYYQYLIHSIEVNPLNGVYRIGESVGASVRAYISDMLSSVFGLDDIMTTSEAVGKDFPEGRVFVKKTSDGVTDGKVTIDGKTWVYMSAGLDTTYTAGGGSVHVVNNSSSGIYWTIVRNYMLCCSFITSGDGTFSVTPGTSSKSSELITGNGYLFGSSYYWSSMDYLWAYVGGDQYSSIQYGVDSFYNTLSSPPSGNPEYSDPIVVINDNETPIISPTSVYNNWQTISNNNYNDFTTNYVTYDMGDSIYNYTYYYSVNNYNTDTPLWVINGDNIPIYDYDVPTLVDVDSLEFETRSVDINSNFYQDVYEGLPSKVSVLVITMGFGVLAVALLKK